MRKLATTLLFGKDARLSGLIAFVIIGAIALGCTCNKFGDLGKTDNSNSSTTPSNTTAPPPPSVPKPDASTGQVPSDAQLQEMTRTTILDFNDAIKSGDFSNFHRTVSKPFQKQASPEKMADAFKAFTEAKIDFSEVETLPATYSPPASIKRTSGVKHLQATGFYETTPRKMKFDLKYVPEGKDWKLIAIEVNTKDEPLTNSVKNTTSSSGVSIDTFNSLKTGMSYDEVVEILGKEGEVLSETDMSGTKTVMYKWDGDSGYGSNMNAMFQNGKLISKSQFGLK